MRRQDLDPHRRRNREAGRRHAGAGGTGPYPMCQKPHSAPVTRLLSKKPNYQGSGVQGSLEVSPRASVRRAATLDSRKFSSLFPRFFRLRIIGVLVPTTKYLPNRTLILRFLVDGAYVSFCRKNSHGDATSTIMLSVEHIPRHHTGAHWENQASSRLSARRDADRGFPLP